MELKNIWDRFIFIIDIRGGKLVLLKNEHSPLEVVHIDPGKPGNVYGCVLENLSIHIYIYIYIIIYIHIYIYIIA